MRFLEFVVYWILFLAVLYYALVIYTM